MLFGIREIANVTFKALSDQTIGSTKFIKYQPVLHIDSAKTSTVEGAATSVYAQGGRGNTRLIAWEGEKTLTFTVEDALLSPLGFAILSGAGLLHDIKQENAKQIHVHATTRVMASDNEIDLSNALLKEPFLEKICPLSEAPIFVAVTEDDGSLTGNLLSSSKFKVNDEGNKLIPVQEGGALTLDDGSKIGGKNVFVDYYIIRNEANTYEMQIDAERFAGNYYVEADTLFRSKADGKDLPAILTFPNVKIQSNFTFSMASTGDPSTFTFTMDAFPGYTMFDQTKQVLCVMQIVEDAVDDSTGLSSVMAHVEPKATA